MTQLDVQISDSETISVEVDESLSRYTDEEVEDVVGSLLSGGPNVSLSYDDTLDSLTIDTSALNEEEVEDTVSTLLSTDPNLTLNYNDSNDVLKVGLDNSISATSLQAGQIDNDDYHETVITGNVSGTTGLDLTTSNLFRHTLTSNVTFSFDNPNADPPGNSFTLIIQQDSTGGHSITWPSSVEWDNGTAPSLTTAANDKHVLGFLSSDGGATWVGVVSAMGVA